MYIITLYYTITFLCFLLIAIANVILPWCLKKIYALQSHNNSNNIIIDLRVQKTKAVYSFYVYEHSTCMSAKQYNDYIDFRLSSKRYNKRDSTIYLLCCNSFGNVCHTSSSMYFICFSFSFSFNDNK